MRAFYDTEFIEAPGRRIDLVSVGVVREDGAEYYAVSTGFDEALAGPWVRRHVLSQLPSPSDRAWRSPDTIREELAAFLAPDGREPETWAWYGAYDHVVVAQLYGTMPEMPRLLPRWTRDLRQLWWHVGSPPLPKQAAGQHDALEDARHNARVYDVLAPLAARRGITV